MSYITIAWGILLTMFIGVPGFYYYYMKRFSSRPWNVNQQNEHLFPPVTILVPAYNEESIIKFKMENLMKLDYPRDKLHIVIINDGSQDGTIKKVIELKESITPSMKIEILDHAQRRGKTESLNKALKNVKTEVVVVSDADCFWLPDILNKALPYLSDPAVGAVTGLEILFNPAGSWVTKTEALYNSTVHTIRVGESKFHSTIFFQGGFGAFKRSLFEQFDENADDSGTALNIVQKGARTLLLPEAIYFTGFPGLWKGKMATKLRRAGQLIGIWSKCLNLFFKRKLSLPKRIFMPEAYLYLINPFVFLLLIPTSVLVILEEPLVLLPLFALLIAAGFSERFRTLMVESVQDQLILLTAIFSSAFKRNFHFWSTAEASRTCVNREMLESKGLV